MKLGSIIQTVVLMVGGLGALLACQDELESRYNNLDETAEASIDQFFTAMLNNNRVWPRYWEMSTFVNWHVGVYTQAVGFLNSESLYQQNDSYIQDRWDDFYRPSDTGAGVMSVFREIESRYEASSDDARAQAALFYQAARVVLFDRTSEMVDLWGDIPFSEAGMLSATGEVVYPAFDDQQVIYDTLLAGLEAAASYFSSAAPTTTAQNLFSQHDILLSGDLDQWQRYANSIRLRLWMRLSYVVEARAQAAVLAMLADADTYPLVASDAYDPQDDDVLLQPLSGNTEDLEEAFSDWTNYPAPYYAMEEVLKPANDPRIPILYDKYGQIKNAVFVPNTDYTAMPLTLTRIEQQTVLGQHAIVDSSTYLYNISLPGVVCTAAEVSFLKAEAYERWGGGDAEAAFQAGIKESIAFYYYLNSLNNTPKEPLDTPTDAELEAFVDTCQVLQYTGTTEEKLALIATQKWLHFGFLQATQSWAELRRTGYPLLTFQEASLTGYELPPARLTYPGNEKLFNSHYQDVASQDTRDTQIFWDVE